MSTHVETQQQAVVSSGVAYDRRMLFFTSCLSLVCTSMVFSIRGDAEPALRADFHLNHEQMGLIFSAAIWPFALAIFFSGALVDFLGMRLLHAVSAIGYVIGLGMIILTPHPNVTGELPSVFASSSTMMLYIGFLITGLSQGLVEGVINPLTATIYKENRTTRLNLMHAWWPGGLVIGGLIAFFLSKFNVGWQIKLGIIIIPVIAYLLMVLSQKYPQTERVTSKVTTGEMWKESVRPIFILLFCCMWLTAATELAPDQWFPSVMGNLTGVQTNGILFLVYTAGLMFILRSFAGPIIHKLSPPGVLLMCSVISAAGLWWLGSLQPGVSVGIAFAAATVFGFGKTFFWPTMLGVSAEQCPKGGALLISILGGVGMLAVAVALPWMGGTFDKLGPGAALQHVAYLPIVLTVVFAAMYFYYQSKGGYKPVELTTEEPVAAGEM